MSQNQIFLAIEGGNVATEALVLNSAGDVLSWEQRGEVSPQKVGMSASLQRLTDLQKTLTSSAGLPPGQVFDRVCAFIAGIDFEDQRSQIVQGLSMGSPRGSVVVENDVHAVLWAGLRRPAGVAVICGAGINAIARSATGRVATYLALGRISGDWGGGLELGREVLFAASRAEDRRGPQTILRFLVAAHFSRPTVRQVSVDIHNGLIDSTGLVELVDVLFDADKNGDVVARELIDRLASEILVVAKSAMTRALVPPTGSNVILAGSVLRAGHSRLDELIDSQFESQLPGALVSRLVVPSIVGSAVACLGASQGGPVPNRLYNKLIANMKARAPERFTSPLTR